MNKRALQDKYAQLAIQIRAQQRLCDKLKEQGHTTKYADANRKLRKLREERSRIAERL